jgi:hypothetical protein
MKAGKDTWRTCAELDSDHEHSRQMAFFPANLKKFPQNLRVPEKVWKMNQGSKRRAIRAETETI